MISKYKNSRTLCYEARMLAVISFAWFVLSFAFLHSHTTPSGRLVVHSHPYPHQEQESPKKPAHDHSTLEFLYYNLNNPEHHLNYVPVLPGFNLNFEKHISPLSRIPPLRRGYVVTLQIRAPPFLPLYFSV